VGNFDGVHLGHARIIERLIRSARAIGGPAIAFTFDPHPAVLLRPDRMPPPLTTTERKAALLGRLGVDAVVAYPTDRDFLELSAREFFDRILVDVLGVRAVVEGPNFFFGHDRRGNVEVLKQFCSEASIDFQVVDPYDCNGQIVSSSRTRQCLAEGRVAEVAAMLTQPYRVHGMVVHGAGRGANLGFPTANVDMVQTLLPCEGIYAGRGYVEGQPIPAAISLGPNPTFDEGGLKLEVFLLDFEGDLYGQLVEVDFLARLRDIERYDSVDALLEQMHRDVEKTRHIVQQAES
jgi:riboflavin kinase/FMN adenylyltransferase